MKLISEYTENDLEFITEDKNGNVIPLVFRTYDEAQAELDDYLGEVQDQIDSGEREPNHGYDANEFRVIMSEQE